MGWKIEVVRSFFVWAEFVPIPNKVFHADVGGDIDTPIVIGISLADASFVGVSDIFD